ncbi:hypothetical protein ACFVS2_20165 [Brevibacillus sp. NPDC058079]|uniref:hypothetical protein n=1 Tax=Brevibacillus sp. NPDC058079 TaxID=3346330 RepID=UPI0036E7EE7F
MAKVLFSWLNDDSRIRIHTLLGNYLSYYLKQNYPNPTIEEFNGINRDQLTRLFLQKNGQSCSFLVHKYNYTTIFTFTEAEFRRDISQFFDLKMPLFYFRLTVVGDKDWINYKKRYKGISMFPGMKFQTSSNYEREKDWIDRCVKFSSSKRRESESLKSETFELVPNPFTGKARATKKQISFIRGLCSRAGLVLVNGDNFDYSTASITINALLRGKYQSPAFIIRSSDGKIVTNGNFRRFEKEMELLEKLNAIFEQMSTKVSTRTKLTHSNRKNAFIRPWIEALGYDMTNHEEVFEDFVISGGKSSDSLDFVIRNNQIPQLFVKYTDSQDSFLQYIATRKKFLKAARYFIVTDGLKFCFYVNHFKFGIILLHTHSLGDDTTEILHILESFSKETFFDQEEPVLLKELLREQLRETAVDHFKDMLKNPSSELISLFEKEGFEEEVVASLFPQAVNEFVQDLAKTSKPNKAG